jgi:competence ComEA-like helix-hairpin-helix protein
VWLGWIAFIWSFDNLTDEPSIVHHAVSYRIDINAANWIEISQLKGIGPVLAKRIVESRDADGPFLSVEDVQRVRGIGPKKLEANRDWIRVNHISSD